jgi:hypothetical protein
MRGSHEVRVEMRFMEVLSIRHDLIERSAMNEVRFGGVELRPLITSESNGLCSSPCKPREVKDCRLQLETEPILRAYVHKPRLSRQAFAKR